MIHAPGLIVLAVGECRVECCQLILSHFLIPHSCKDERTDAQPSLPLFFNLESEATHPTEGKPRLLVLGSRF